MKNISNLIDKLVDGHKRGKDFDVLGEGSYSIVWDFDGKAYKLSNELTYERAMQMKDKNNKLHKNGVNVPEISQIDPFDLSTNSLISNLKSLRGHYDEESYYKLLSDMSTEYKNDKGQYTYVGIEQQKIDGYSCFEKLPSDWLITAEKICQRVKTLPQKVKDNLEIQLNNNLDYFLNISDEHYQKFFQDATNIINAGLSIDNQMKSNFIYTNNGFYFIDLDGIQKGRAISGIDNIFEATVDNVCGLVSTSASGYSPKIAEKQLELASKLIKNMIEVNDKGIAEMRKKYLGANNTGLQKLYMCGMQNCKSKNVQKYIAQIGKFLGKDESDHSFER